MATRKNKRQERGDARLADTRERVLAAAVELLLHGGLEAVTAVRLHEQTGIARTTIYRHWADRQALLLATFDRILVPHHQPKLTGELARDLLSTLTMLKKRIEYRPVREMFAALQSAGVEDEMFVPVLQRFTDGLLMPTREVLLRAKKAGELRGVGIDRALARLAGPLLHRHVLEQRTIQPKLVREVVTSFLGR